MWRKVRKIRMLASQRAFFDALIVMTILVMAILLAPAARAQDGLRPPVGGVISPADAMIFYLARGQDGACGPDCSEWIAAEGIVEWDTFKRLFAFAARLGERKLPVILNVWGESDLKVAMSLGKIIRDRGLDVSAGKTVVAGCADATEIACMALKRSGKSLDAAIDTSAVECDTVCVLILAGGVHRTLPAGAKVFIGPTHVRDRLAPNVSEERQKGLLAYYGDQYRIYLKQMGVATDVVGIIEQNAASGRATQILRADWLRLGIVTGPAL
jgi:hypothetical protein